MCGLMWDDSEYKNYELYDQMGRKSSTKVMHDTNQATRVSGSTTTLNTTSISIIENRQKIYAACWRYSTASL